jgi:RNA polymerase sigma-70 factor (ECF subfamily)
VSAQPDPVEQDELEAAREGDEAAFRRLVEPRRRELYVHCYRMLGSLLDAEDALQDALLRAWRGLPGFDGRSSLRSWLYRIATNASLDVAGRRSKVPVLPIDEGPAATGGWDQDSGPVTESGLWLQPLPDDGADLAPGPAAPEATYEQRESVELAFTAALQRLPPNQRAALIMRDVLGFTAQEVAEAMATSEASVKSALQRARAAIEERLPDRSQQSTLRTLGDARTRAIVRRYTDALESGDVDQVVGLLAEDATWSMPPYPQWYSGLDSITEFLRTGPGTQRWRHLPTGANGQPAVGCYRWDAPRGVFAASVIDVLTLRHDGRIAAVTAFVDAGLFARFGLPDHIAP